MGMAFQEKANQLDSCEMTICDCKITYVTLYEKYLQIVHILDSDNEIHVIVYG